MNLPPSKSHTMRALLFEHLANKQCIVSNMLDAPEVNAFRATLQNWNQTFYIDVKNSGLALHLLIALASLSNEKRVITGDFSICNLRPIAPLIEALQMAGAKIRYLEKPGFAPIEIQGPIHASNVSLSGTNSQHVSALLIAFSQIEGNSTIEVLHPKETPYVQMTLDWLFGFKAHIKNENFTHFKVEGSLKIPSFAYQVPPDFSSLAFIVAANQILGLEQDFSHLNFQDSQPDKAIFDLLNKKECSIESSPDLLPILMVLAVYGLGPTSIFNIHVARQKESDRPFAMQQELAKMGAKIKIDLEKDAVFIEPTPLKGAHLEGHQDHRIVMSLSVAALKAAGETLIDGVACVAKTFPNFFETYCPDRFAKIWKNDLGQVTICPSPDSTC